MNKFSTSVLTAVAALGLWSVDLAQEAPWYPVFTPEAEAVIGRPLTPVSYAGVARRTTRRAVVATSSAQQQQAGQQQAQQQAAAASALPQGTVVSALPTGCTSTTVDGVSLFNCGGVMYQPKFQGNTLVYVVM